MVIWAFCFSLDIYLKRTNILTDKYAIILPGSQAYDTYMGIDTDLLNALTKCFKDNNVELKTISISEGTENEPRANKSTLNRYMDKMDTKDSKLRCVIYMLQ